MSFDEGTTGALVGASAVPAWTVVVGRDSSLLRLETKARTMTTTPTVTMALAIQRVRRVRLRAEKSTSSASDACPGEGATPKGAAEGGGARKLTGVGRPAAFAAGMEATGPFATAPGLDPIS